MIEFKNTKGIFQQIADNLCDNILSGKFKVGDKIPSIREQAASLGVNHNTIMRTYTELQREEIIFNKRGIGYFVAETAHQQITASRKKEFFNHALPELEHQVTLLKVKLSEVESLIEKLKQNENQ